ncbi:MAG: hypothetical protein ABSB87_05705 [Terriglobales bacterium]|jgi:hypothetical protein
MQLEAAFNFRPFVFHGGTVRVSQGVLPDTRTFHVQQWLDQIGQQILSRHTLKHIKSVISGIFTLAKQQHYFDGINLRERSGDKPNRRRTDGDLRL